MKVDLKYSLMKGLKCDNTQKTQEKFSLKAYKLSTSHRWRRKPRQGWCTTEFCNYRTLATY